MFLTFILISLFNFSSDALSVEEREKILTTASAISHKMGAVDCSHFVCRVYARAGFNYDYADVVSFAEAAERGESKFVRVQPDQAERGDVVLFLKSEENRSNHMGIVSKVSERGEIELLVSSTIRYRSHKAKGQKRLKKVAVVRQLHPKHFQSKNAESVTYRVYRWQSRT